MPRYDDHIPERTLDEVEREQRARLNQIDATIDGFTERRAKVHKPAMICLDENPALDCNGRMVREHLTPSDVAELLGMDVQELLGMFVKARVRQLRIKGFLFEISLNGFVDYLRSVGVPASLAHDYENWELREEIALEKKQPEREGD